MKKALVFCFLFSYLFSTTELSQFWKLPALIGHFDEHKKKDAQTTLWSFLCMHYNDNGIPDADDAKDRQLPFKTHDDCQNTIKEITFESYTASLKPVCFEYHVMHSCYKNSFSSAFLSCIWQPPKSC